MIILVADTSVIVDLERGNLLAAALSGPDVLAAPDLLYESELRDYGGRELLRLGLKILELTPPELSIAQTLFNTQAGLALPDCAALVGASRPQHELLTGDGKLRAHAERQGVTCHGVLWLMDRLEANATVAPQVLHAALTDIVRHPRCRLPRHEVNARLSRWQP